MSNLSNLNALVNKLSFDGDYRSREGELTSSVIRAADWLPDRVMSRFKIGQKRFLEFRIA